jgi:hypothetical protein
VLSPATIPALYDDELAIRWSESNRGELGLDVLGPEEIKTCCAAKLAGISASNASFTMGAVRCQRAKNVTEPSSAHPLVV